MKQLPQPGKFRRQGRDPGKHQQIPPARAEQNRRNNQKGFIVKKIAMAVALALGLLAFVNSNPATGTVSVVEAAPAASQGCHILQDEGPWPVQPKDVAQNEIDLAWDGYAHGDFYPWPDKRTISYIFEPVGRIAVYHGFGKAWHALKGCAWETYDWLGDAANYQKGRRAVNTSGLVANVNQRAEGNFIVVHLNVFGLSEAEVCAIIADHNPSWKFDDGRPPVWQLQEIGMDASRCGSAPAPVVVTTIAPPTQPVVQVLPLPPSGGNCEPATKLIRDPKVGEAFRFNDSGGYVIINGWTNEPGQSQAEFTILLAPGENPALLVGGSYYIRPAHCLVEAEGEISTSPITRAGNRVNLDHLRGRGLVR